MKLRSASLIVMREKKHSPRGPVVVRLWLSGVLKARYRSGKLVAVELFAPCPIANFDRLHLSLSDRERQAIRRFIKGASRGKW